MSQPGSTLDRPAAPVAARTVVTASVGNFVEYFDWGVYAAFSGYFSKQIFAAGDPTAALLNTLAVFALGFLMRPIGGYLLGMLADRAGRRTAMLVTVGMMAGGSLLIAVVPTYRQIGAFAAVILVIARMAQGLAVGGEFGTAAAYLAELAPRHRRGFYGSFQYLTIIAGTLLASLLGFILTHALTESALTEWGWRIPFGLGALLGLTALFFRRGGGQPRTAAAPDTAPPTLRALLGTHRRGALSVLTMTMSTAVIYYLWATFLPGYTVREHGLDAGDSFLASTIALAVLLVAQPFAGLLSDRVGRKPLLFGYAIGFIVVGVPLVLLLNDTMWSLLVVLIVGYLFFSLYSASSAAVKSEQFPAGVRGLGVSLPYATASALFGGTAPYLLTWASSHGLGWLFWAYVLVLLAVSAVSFRWLRETNGVALS